MAFGMRCDHCGHGIHGELLAESLHRTYLLRFRGSTGQWQVHQECKRQKDGCQGLSMDPETAYTRPAHWQLPAGPRHRTTAHLLQAKGQLDRSGTHKMQKFLKLLNFRLDVVVKDVCGLTGMKIIEDICKGNLDPYRLAEHRHYNCRKTKEEIARALHGNNRQDYLFGLEQELENYKFCQRKIKACDQEIKRTIKHYINKNPESKKLSTTENHISVSTRTHRISRT